MKLQPIQNNSYKYDISFHSWKREVYGRAKINDINKLLYRNDTAFFRGSEFWAQFSHFLTKTYKNTPKVNVYSYGCSDGSEPYTFVMRMLSMYPKEEADKFLPVIAKDCDKVAIKKALNREEYFMHPSEKSDINYYTRNQYDRFFRLNSTNKDGENVSIQDELFQNVKFSIADIARDCKKIAPNNSVVIARNFWPYIESVAERQEVLNEIGKHLGEKSFLVIGQYDQLGTYEGIDKQILAAGFKYTEVPFVFEKVPNEIIFLRKMPILRHFF